MVQNYKAMPKPDDPRNGMPEAAMAAAFSRRVSHVRERLDACLRTGLIPDGLLQEMKCLKQEQKALLTEALPRYRRLHLNDPERNLNVTVTPVTGSLEPGKLADLIVTEGNPLEDLQTLRNVSMVVTGGKIIDHPKVKKMPQVEQELDKFL